MGDLSDLTTVEQLTRILSNPAQLAASTLTFEQLAKEYNVLGLDHPRIKAYQAISRYRVTQLADAFSFTTMMRILDDVPLNILQDRFNDVINYVSVKMSYEEKELRRQLQSDQENGVQIHEIPLSELPAEVDFELATKMSSLYYVSTMLAAQQQRSANPGLLHELAVVEDVNMISDEIGAAGSSSETETNPSPVLHVNVDARTDSENVVMEEPLAINATSSDTDETQEETVDDLLFENTYTKKPDRMDIATSSGDQGSSSSSRAEDEAIFDIANALLSLKIPIHQPETVVSLRQSVADRKIAEDLKKAETSSMDDSFPFTMHSLSDDDPSKSDNQVGEVSRKKNESFMDVSFGNSRTFDFSFLDFLKFDNEVGEVSKKRDRSPIRVSHGKYFVYDEYTNYASDNVYIETLDKARTVVKLVKVTDERIYFKPYEDEQKLKASVSIPVNDFINGRAFICRKEEDRNTRFVAGTGTF